MFMPQSAVRRRDTTKVTTYNNFRGVDFSTESVSVSRNRVAYGQNFYIDTDGFPEKRPGIRTTLRIPKFDTSGNPIAGQYDDTVAIYGLFHAKYNLSGEAYERNYVFAGDKVYRANSDFTALIDYRTILEEATTYWYAQTANGEDFKRVQMLQQDYVILFVTGNGFFKDVLILDHMYPADGGWSGFWYVPTTTINRLPSGGGEQYEDVNLATRERKNTFVGDGTSNTFVLDGPCNDASGVTVEIGGEAVTGFTLAASTTDNASITFTTPPPDGDGLANVTVQFSAYGESDADVINKAMYATTLQYGNGKYYILSNGDTDYQSALDDPTYFPDRGYCVYEKNCAIKGYANMADTVCVFVDSTYGPTVYLRNVIESGGMPIFPAAVTPGVHGETVLSGDTIAYVNGDPLMLTRRGIYSLTSLNVASQTVMRNRSHFLDGKLLEETFEVPVACTWDNRYILAVGGNAYVLDGNLSKSYPSTVNDVDYSYEGTYWTNINARCFLVEEGACYFGTPDGRVKRFNNDISDMSRYNDDGAAIVTVMATRVDDDGDFMTTKTMKKKGSGIMLKPFTRSSANVYVTTNKAADKLIRSSIMDILDWNDIDFNRFTFHTQDGPQVVPFLKKEKKYVTLQIIVKNDAVNEGFGVIGIIKRFETVNYVKR